MLTEKDIYNFLSSGVKDCCSDNEVCKFLSEGTGITDKLYLKAVYEAALAALPTDTDIEDSYKVLAAGIYKRLAKRSEILTDKAAQPANDPVNHPVHYTNGKYETIDIIQDKLTPEQFEGFCVGNAIKYITRYKLKGGLEDLEKAVWYLNKIIEVKSGE